MKPFYQEENEEIGEAITRMLEKETGKEIFTMRVFDHEFQKDAFEIVVAFTDKSVMMGAAFMQQFEGKWACRIKASYI